MLNIIIKLKLLQPEDAEALLKFEAENRAFFETTVPSRGEQGRSNFYWLTYNVK
jgi:hypothetical protein